LLFEEHPWLLVTIIVATVEAGNLTKAVSRELLQRRRDNDASGGLGRE